jgi:hypothetical protein
MSAPVLVNYISILYISLLILIHYCYATIPDLKAGDPSVQLLIAVFVKYILVY